MKIGATRPLRSKKRDLNQTRLDVQHSGFPRGADEGGNERRSSVRCTGVSTGTCVHWADTCNFAGARGRGQGNDDGARRNQRRAHVWFVPSQGLSGPGGI